MLARPKPHRPLLHDHAAAMRAAPTPAEARLWQALRGARLGVRFARQVPLGGKYVADFAAREARLVVEVDGSSHRLRGVADARRDRDLGRLGWRVLRVSADLVHQDLEAVLALVHQALAQ